MFPYSQLWTDPYRLLNFKPKVKLSTVYQARRDSYSISTVIDDRFDLMTSQWNLLRFTELKRDQCYQQSSLFSNNDGEIPVQLLISK